MKKVLVSPKGKPSYEVLIDAQMDFSPLIPFIAKKQVLVVTNDTVKTLFYAKMEAELSSQASSFLLCELKDGEQYKSHESLNQIYQILLKNNYTRECVLVALGGGVIGDITGFAAATYLRGVSVIQVPTTLLSQVDSSVGGKTAINHLLGKNMIGAFFQPQLVYTATNVLDTLSDREYRAGLAEVVKYGCIIDGVFFDYLEKHVTEIRAKDPSVLSYIIARSCALKAEVVKADELEKTGVRALLNLGHTFGHGIECCQNYTGLRHGEAVGVGMVIAAKFSYQLGLVNADVVKRISNLLQALLIPVEMPEGIDQEAFVAAMLRDKKNVDGKNITFVLLGGIGQARVDKTISMEKLKIFLETEVFV
nr:3-dehydroquinate synthase [Fangia hongkongensis]